MQGVFAVTTSFSIIAYVWMYQVLSDELVEPYEAWITLALMPLLIIVALAADKMSGSGDDVSALFDG